MNSVEAWLTVGAVSVEVGTPVLLATLYSRRPSWRAKVIVVLGALTPAVLVYAATTVAFLIDPENPGNRFAFYAGPVMTFLAFVGCLFIGCALAWIPWPRNYAFRYFAGVGLVVALGAFLRRW